MEHKERNNGIRLKMLEEIADIEAFSFGREAADLTADKNVAESRGHEPH